MLCKKSSSLDLFTNNAKYRYCYSIDKITRVKQDILIQCVSKWYHSRKATFDWNSFQYHTYVNKSKLSFDYIRKNFHLCVLLVTKNFDKLFKIPKFTILDTKDVEIEFKDVELKSRPSSFWSKIQRNHYNLRQLISFE